MLFSFLLCEHKVFSAHLQSKSARRRVELNYYFRHLDEVLSEGGVQHDMQGNLGYWLNLQASVMLNLI